MECIRDIIPLTKFNEVLYSGYNYVILEVEGEKYMQFQDAFLDALAEDYISIYGDEDVTYWKH